MSLVIMESCDLINGIGYNGKKWTNRDGTFNLTDNETFLNRKCWTMRQSSTTAKNFGTLEHGTVIVGMRLAYPWAGPTSGANALIRFFGDDGTVAHIAVTTTATGAIRVYRGATQIAETEPAIYPASIWFYLQVRVVIDATAGEVQIQVDRTEVLNETGLDTREGGTDALIDRVELGSNFNDARVRDIFMATGDSNGVSALFPRAVSIEAKVPTGAGDLTQFTPNTGANWDAVNEDHPDDDTTYVESDTGGERDSYVMEDAVSIVEDPVAVSAYCIARYLDSPLGLGVFLRRTTTNDDGDIEDVIGSYASHGFYIWETDPIAAGAWTLANFNATEFGLVSGA